MVAPEESFIVLTKKDVTVKIQFEAQYSGFSMISEFEIFTDALKYSFLNYDGRLDDTSKTRSWIANNSPQISSEGRHWIESSVTTSNSFVLIKSDVPEDGMPSLWVSVEAGESTIKLCNFNYPGYDFRTENSVLKDLEYFLCTNQFHKEREKLINTL
jgi:hypothetical protein